MSEKNNKTLIKNLTFSAIFVFAILILDQSLKIWVKTNMFIGENSLDDWNWPIRWAQLYFIENNGMAFGFTIGDGIGIEKVLLSSLRIVAIIAIIIFIIKISKKEINKLLLVCMSLILAGAIGNMIDSAFYGIIFSESGYNANQIAEFMPQAGGYGKLLHGKVVDMLYFPLIDTKVHTWLAKIIGDDFIFFRPIFNIADSAVTIGVALLLIFYKKLFAGIEEKKADEGIIEKEQ